MTSRHGFRIWGRETPDVTKEDYEAFVVAFKDFCGVEELPIPEEEGLPANMRNLLSTTFGQCVGVGVWVDGEFRLPVEELLGGTGTSLPMRRVNSPKGFDLWIRNFQWLIREYGLDDGLAKIHQAIETIAILPALRSEANRMADLVRRAEPEIRATEKVDAIKNGINESDPLFFTGLLPQADYIIIALEQMNDSLGRLREESGIDVPELTEFVVGLCGSAWHDGHRDFSPLVLASPELGREVLLRVNDETAPELLKLHKTHLYKVKDITVLVLEKGNKHVALSWLSSLSVLFSILFLGGENLNEMARELGVISGIAQAEKDLRVKNAWKASSKSSDEKPVGEGETGGVVEHDGTIALSPFTRLKYRDDVVEELQKAVALKSHVLLVGNSGAGQRLTSRCYYDASAIAGSISGPFVDFDVFRLNSTNSDYPRNFFADAANGMLLVENLDRHLTPQNNKTSNFLELFRIEMSIRSNVIVVATAREESIDSLQAANPDLYRRFTVVRLSDYTTEELTGLTVNMLAENELDVPDDTQSAILEYFSFKRQAGNLRNARKAEKLVEKVIASRLHRNADDTAVTIEDVPAVAEPPRVPVREKLDALVGLYSVKREVNTLFAEAAAQSRRLAAGVHLEEPMRHMVFSGNPGTGKTTVARLIGEVFAETGLLASGHLVEVGRQDLVAGYLGQSAGKVVDVVERALGGVLFIDEAYSLDGGDRGAGERNGRLDREAIDTLVKLMEDNRHDLVVIAAGYTKPMQQFLENNPGLSSRFSKVIEFPDYGDDELVEIFEKFVDSAGMRLDEGVLDRMRAVFADAPRGDSFGNARFARTLFEHAVAEQANRLLEEPDGDAGLLKPQDVNVDSPPQKVKPSVGKMSHLARISSSSADEPQRKT